MKNEMQLSSSVEKMFTQKEIEEILKDEQRFYIEHAEKNWLNRYFKIKAIANETKVPSIVSSISDMPHGSSNFKKSKTEMYAIKTIQASEWLEILGSTIQLLSPIEQELIELKYLRRRNDGARYSDESIYPQLYIGKTRYYEIKKEALEILGRHLYGVFAEKDFS
ncbi:ArpU family phage packaging/lysis transcriptional regulator [Virgibacillus salexigens]|uniref:ArpU family phage packaging/lysis transcriptional regulator n=1 Tax=Virgibacillus salexigens TaxID=61016 RepID=UPI001F2B45D1|nr:ArpU family phage packaging/lysis transcriptional regulator [Virgibacillus salexigens]